MEQLEPELVRIWDTSITNGGLTCWTTIPASYPTYLIPISFFFRPGQNPEKVITSVYKIWLIIHSCNLHFFGVSSSVTIKYNVKQPFLWTISMQQKYWEKVTEIKINRGILGLRCLMCERGTGSFHILHGSNLTQIHHKKTKELSSFPFSLFCRWLFMAVSATSHLLQIT